MNSTLIAHNPRFNSQLCNLRQLQTLPDPVALGPRHRPVAHKDLVETIHREIDSRGYLIDREQMALSRDRQRLFGVIDLVPKGNLWQVDADKTRGTSFGFRNSVDRTMGIQAVAGTRVFVCDNLAMSGDMFAIRSRNTTGLDLPAAVEQGFQKFLDHTRVLTVQINALRQMNYSDLAAKELIYDFFMSKDAPISDRLLPAVHQNYFHPTDEMTDCQPRTLWGIHNAFTRAIQVLAPTAMFAASIALGKRFYLTAGD